MAEQRAARDPEGVTITPMSEHDLLEIVEIEEQSGLSRWGWAAYYAELQGGNRELMLIARPSHSSILEPPPIAGYIVARETAGALLNRVIEEARRRQANAAFLEVRSANQAAQALYEKCGFKAIARRANYYSE